MRRTACSRAARGRCAPRARAALGEASREGIPGAAPLLLRGFDAIPPQLAAIAAARPVVADTASPTVAPAPADPRLVRPPDTTAELEAITAWCPDTPCLGSARAPARHAPRPRRYARAARGPDPRGAGSGAVFSPARAGAASSASRVASPLPHSRCRPRRSPDWGSCAPRSPIWRRSPAGLQHRTGTHPPAPQRAALALMLRQRGLSGLDLRALLGALQLAPRELKAPARELDGRLRRAASALQRRPRLAAALVGALRARARPAWLAG